MVAADSFLKTAPMPAKNAGTCLLGGSMGAATVMSYARANIAKVLAICYSIPLLDVNASYQSNAGGYQSSIGTAYGVTYPTAIPALATHSANSFSNADLVVIGSVPITLYASDNDPIASNTAACQAWAAKVAADGAAYTPTVISMGSLGHGVLNPFPNNDVVNFFNANGGTT